MKIKRLLLFFAFALQFSLVHAQVSLTGTWELYNKDGGAPVGGVFMTVIQTGDTVKASGTDWAGEGRFDAATNTGFYNWTFTDGKTGTTSFAYDPVYDMIPEGSVSGSGIGWAFIGRRTRPLTDFTGSYKNNGPSLSILTIKQTANRIDTFLKASDFYYYGTGVVIGNLAIVNYVRIGEFDPTLAPNGTGRYYLFLSNDLQYVWQSVYPLDPPLLPSCCGGFTRLPVTPVLTPPPGWIGADGAQSCVQRGSGLRLSCQSAEDFEESGYCMDPRTIQLIDYWLSKARPFSGWDKAYYDCWGRWVGTSRNGEARGNCHRPETGGKTRCEYVLEQLRGTFPNVAPSLVPAMDLEAYLIRKLTGE